MLEKLGRAAWLLRHGGRLRPTFSQFGEDSALRALLRPQRCGVYVDVGANDPVVASNTALLYYLGWDGLAIDPNPAFAARFRAVRPRDVYLTRGVASTPAELTYFQFKRHQMNTFSTARALQLTNEGDAPIGKTTIPCSPLDDLVAEHLPGRHIDLLAVDCEGFDLDVLKSANLQKLRPTALMVEDFARYCHFRDGTPQTEFDHYLRGCGYAPIYQGGWSSIYVHRLWRELPRGAFRPPEGLDDYMPKP